MPRWKREGGAHLFATEITEDTEEDSLPADVVDVPRYQEYLKLLIFHRSSAKICVHLRIHRIENNRRPSGARCLALFCHRSPKCLSVTNVDFLGGLSIERQKSRRNEEPGCWGRKSRHVTRIVDCVWIRSAIARSYRAVLNRLSSDMDRR